MVPQVSFGRAVRLLASSSLIESIAWTGISNKPPFSGAPNPSRPSSSAKISLSPHVDMVTGTTSHVDDPEEQKPPQGGQTQHPEDNYSLSDKLKDFKVCFLFSKRRRVACGLRISQIKAIHLKQKIGKFENLVNKNHRHDEEHEQRTDAKRTRIAEGHRFQSFAPEREQNNIKWYIDGRGTFLYAY